MLVNHFLENSAQRLPEKVCLVFKDKRFTYAEIDKVSNQLAHTLIELGIKRGDRVAIYIENSPEAVISLFGILKAGAIFSVLNPLIKPRKLQYILNNCQASCLVTHTTKLSALLEIINTLPHLKSIILAGDKKEIELKNKTIIFWEDITSYPKTQPSSKCIDQDLATIIYTSGSTGEPKGVMFTHHGMVSAATSIIQYLENVESDIILDVLPLSFDYSLYQVLMAFKIGARVVLDRPFSYPYPVIELMLKEKITGFPGVPTIFAFLLSLENIQKYNFDFVRYVTNTAAALPPAFIPKLQKLFPNAKIYSMYGLTECKRVSYLPPKDLEKKPTSVGIPMPNTEVYIVNEKGEKVRPGEVGELVVRGSNLMRGYWGDPEATEKVLRPCPYPGEKVLYTGDLFKIDEDGYLYFVGRKDDMIKSRGERISPKEIENVLYELKGVKEAAVIGVPDQLLGQVIKAFIVTKDSIKLTEKDVIKHCTKHLEYFMVPKYVEFRSSLPKTSTGKIKKTELE